jgi:FkbM family methyltransferase
MRLLFNVFDRMPASWIRAAGNVRGRSRWLKSATDWLPNMLRNREGRIQKGLGRGLRFNPGQSAVGFLLGTHDLDVQFVLRRLLKPGMVVYDAGANVGFTAVMAARRVQPANGRVVCFEPLPVNASQIRLNASLNQFDWIDVKEIALGATDGGAEFLVSESPTWGRLASAGATPKQSGTLHVPVRSLDSLADAGEIPPPDFIKMDIEGAEADALIGGKRLLARARPVMVIELHHTYDAVATAIADLDCVIHPLLPAGADPSSTDGEFQILCYPREHSEAPAVCAELAAGKLEFD